jgi:hypothetical protein
VAKLIQSLRAVQTDLSLCVQRCLHSEIFVSAVRLAIGIDKSDFPQLGRLPHLYMM